MRIVRMKGNLLIQYGMVSMSTDYPYLSELSRRPILYRRPHYIFLNPPYESWVTWVFYWSHGRFLGKLLQNDWVEWSGVSGVSSLLFDQACWIFYPLYTQHFNNPASPPALPPQPIFRIHASSCRFAGARLLILLPFYNIVCLDNLKNN